MQVISRIHSNSAQYTENLGEALSSHLVEGDLVVLKGTLGSGKTTFVRGIARGLGCHGVTSPTFVLVKEYRGRKVLRHADFFRLETPAEVEDLGLEEILGLDAITVLEWPDPLVPFVAEGYLEVAFELGPGASERALEFRVVGPTFESRATTIAQALGKVA